MVSKLEFKFKDEIRASSNHQEPNAEASVEVHQDSVPQTAHCIDVSGKDPNFFLKIQRPKQLVVFLVYLLCAFKASSEEMGYIDICVVEDTKLSHRIILHPGSAVKMKGVRIFFPVELPLSQDESPIQTYLLK